MPLYKFIKSLLIFSAIFTVSFSIFSSGLNVQAQKIGLKPYSEQGENQRGVFKYTMNAGETVSDTALIVNGSDFDGKARVLAKDSILDTSGQIAFRGNDEPNSGTGNWIKLSQEIVDIPAQKGYKLPFTLTVPQGTKAGEYTAGIIASAQDEKNATSGVAMSARSAITVYIIVKGELSLDHKVSDLTIINPKQEDFPIEVDRRAGITPENMMIRFRAENLGNIYSRLKGKFIVELPNGDKKEIPFQRILNLNNPNPVYYFSTNLPYTLGTSKVVMEFDSEPYNLDANTDFTKSAQSQGKLEYSFTYSQQDVEAFGKVREKLVQKLKDEYKTNPPAQNNDFVVKNEESSKSQEVKTEIKQDNTVIYILSGILLVIVAAFIGYVVYNKRKSVKK